MHTDAAVNLQEGPAMARNLYGDILSHWHQLFEDFSTSTQEFYRSVEEAIRRRNLPEIEVSRVLFKEGGLASAEREYLRIRRKRIAFDICSAPYGSGHFFSWWLAKIPAKYGLLIVLGGLVAALFVGSLFQALFLKVFEDAPCFGATLVILGSFLGVPILLLGLGFLVDQGKLGDEEWVLSVPIVGWLYALIFNPVTYYRLDTALMFQDSIRAAVNEVIDGLLTGQGLRALSEDQKRPSIRDLAG